MIPHARDSAPWAECGDRTPPDFGRVFAHAAAGRAIRLTYDREGLHHALTLRNGADLGATIEIAGRLWDVHMPPFLARAVVAGMLKESVSHD